MNKNLCHVANSDSAVKKLLLPQLLFFKRNGYKVSVACKVGVYGQELEDHGIKVYNIPLSRSFWNLPAHFFCLIKLFALFRREKFDVIHSHNPVPGFLGQLAGFWARIPVRFHTAHGFYFHENSGFVKKLVFSGLEKATARLGHHLFLQSREDFDFAVSKKFLKKKDITHIGNGVDVHRFDMNSFPKDFVAEKKRELQIPENSEVVGIVARLVKEKGYNELCEAFVKVLKTYPNATLVVVGREQKEKRDRISRDLFRDFGIDKNVRFLGEYEKVEEIYAIMNVFVLPSWREGVPRTIIEASAMARPVVATNIRGCREVVEDGKTGFLVPVKSPNALADKILLLLGDKGVAEEMGKNGRQNVLARFSEELVFERLMGIYKEYND